MIYTASWTRLLATLALILFVSGCTSLKKAPSDAGPHSSSQAWQAFINNSVATESAAGPFRVSASLRYKMPQESSTRVSALLWGNGDPQAPYPLRLDIMAGLGSVVAKVREDENAFTVYNLDEKTVYTHIRDDRSLLSMGVPIPLSLSDLSLILTGRAALLVADVASASVPQALGVTKQGTRFAVSGASLPGIIEISPQGTLLSWSDSRAGGWGISFEYTAPATHPRRIIITHGEGYEAVISVKEVEHEQKRFAIHQLELLLPAGTLQQKLAAR